MGYSSYEEYENQIHPYLYIIAQIEKAARDVFLNFEADCEHVENYEALMAEQNQQALNDLFNIMAVTNEAVITAMEKIRLALKLLPKERRDKVGELLKSKDGLFSMSDALVNSRVDVHLEEGEEEAVLEARNYMSLPDAPIETHVALQAKYSGVRIPRPLLRSDWIVRHYLAVHDHGM